jgi:hypothetical protein
MTRCSRGLVEVLSWHLHGDTEENHENPVRIDDFQPENTTVYFPNMSHESYRYTNRLGGIILSRVLVTIRRGLEWMIGFIALIHSTRNYK